MQFRTIFSISTLSVTCLVSFNELIRKEEVGQQNHEIQSLPMKTIVIRGAVSLGSSLQASEVCHSKGVTHIVHSVAVKFLQCIIF